MRLVLVRIRNSLGQAGTPSLHTPVCTPFPDYHRSPRPGQQLLPPALSSTDGQSRIEQRKWQRQVCFARVSGARHRNHRRRRLAHPVHRGTAGRSPVSAAHPSALAGARRASTHPEATVPFAKGQGAARTRASTAGWHRPAEHAGSCSQLAGLRIPTVSVHCAPPASFHTLKCFLHSTCRIGQATTADDAQTLIEYVDLFARYFTPAQLVGAGEIGERLSLLVASLSVPRPDSPRSHLPCPQHCTHGPTACQCACVLSTQFVRKLTLASPMQPIGALTSLVRLLDGFRSVQGGPNNLSTLHPIVLFVSGGASP